MTNSYYKLIMAKTASSTTTPPKIITTLTLSFIITSTLIRTIIIKKTHIEAGLFQLILEIIEMNRKVSLQVGVA